ncbi:MAG: hypothetical protein NTY06_02505 [Candidatus Gottesmanbacteria bacterium]|nr:hypothetical protein [Candidatus Gottesmanbacteria bacterium]
MGAVAKFVLALVIFGVTVSGGSLIWKKLTSAPRPQALQQVRDLVIKTPQGIQAAQVFGVMDDTNVQPINLGQVVGDIGNSIKTAAEERATTILMSQVTTQLMNQYEKLPRDQQQTLQEIICHSSPSGVVK